MAGNFAAVKWRKNRGFESATTLRVCATWMESTSWRRIDGIWVDNAEVCFWQPKPGLGGEDRIEQGPGVWMSGSPEDRSCFCLFDDPSQVHDRHPGGHVLDNGKIVAD